VVVDEYGSFKGIVTLHDLIEAIVGDLPDLDEADDPYIIPREDGSYLIDGRTLIFELNQFFQREIIGNKAEYTTISGFILTQLQQLPKAGDKITSFGFQFEVVDMDGIRIDKILMTKLDP
jgi:putative hemolysin